MFGVQVSASAWSEQLHRPLREDLERMPGGRVHRREDLWITSSRDLSWKRSDIEFTKIVRGSFQRSGTPGVLWTVSSKAFLYVGFPCLEPESHPLGIAMVTPVGDAVASCHGFHVDSVHSIVVRPLIHFLNQSIRSLPGPLNPQRRSPEEDLPFPKTLDHSPKL